MSVERRANAWCGAYAGRRVLVTGHTGFKGGWLATWLLHLGARVTGFALKPATTPHLFGALGLDRRVGHFEDDIRDFGALRRAWATSRPEIVFHLAAQPIVKESYRDPLTTLTTNIVGTAHVLELAREFAEPVAVVCVTSDKCYENVEWMHGYREDDRLGGADVYSGSKAAAELVVSSYRRSFFPSNGPVAVATARAGNVVGGGDWSPDRVVPDCVRALAAGEPVSVRRPGAVRPWQHVLEPLSGYLALGARLMASGDEGIAARSAWNLGPTLENTRSVREMVERVLAEWGEGRWIDASDRADVHEATLLRLAIDKAAFGLGWRPRWDFDTAIRQTVAWYRAFYGGADATALCLGQIEAYLSASGSANGAAV